MSEAVDDRLKRVLVAQLQNGLRPSEISAQTGLYGRGLGMSSLDVVSLIVRIEDEFDIAFEAAEIGEIVRSFGTLHEAVLRKLEAP